MTAGQAPCTEKCWTRVHCEEHGIDMPPAGRSGPDDMPTCEHQHTPANTCHLWGTHDASRHYTDPAGWEAHLDVCGLCAVEHGEPKRTKPITARTLHQQMEEAILSVGGLTKEDALQVAQAIEAAGLLERDEHHTMEELYRYRMLYNAHAARGWAAAGIPVVKSMNHHDGEPVFGAGWFIVTAQLPTGQVSNHYREEDWDLFAVPEVERPPEWDGHTPAQAEERLLESLGQLGYAPVTKEVVVHALFDAAEAAQAIINAGDIAEVAAFPPGATGVREAVAARDSLQEDPAGWLRGLARSVAEEGS